jgi:hypothetical protein
MYKTNADRRNIRFVGSRGLVDKHYRGYLQ